MSYTKLLCWPSLLGFAPLALAHPDHGASDFIESMAHPLLHVNLDLVGGIILPVTIIAACILLAVRGFDFLMKKIAKQKS